MNYYRIMLGKNSKHADECFKGNFIGADFDITIDLSSQLPEDWREFNKKFIPVFLESNPDKTKISAGLACGMLWTIAKGINDGDILLCPDGKNQYYICEVVGPYYYQPSEILPHRRAVRWYPNTIARTEMSQSLQRSTGSIGTTCLITKYTEEVEKLILGNQPEVLFSTDETVENPSLFALETHLEEFLVQNWKHTEIGKEFDIFEDENGTGQQYITDDKGKIDILAISKDKKTLLVVELKKGRASDIVVGQVQRYMGFVKEVLSEKGQVVKGAIIASEDDLRIRRALSVASNIEFYRYQVSFKLFKS